MRKRSKQSRHCGRFERVLAGPAIFQRRPMTVFSASSPPAEPTARCVTLWRAIGIEPESTMMAERFANLGWSGAEAMVMPGGSAPSHNHGHDTLLDVAEISPGLALGGLAIHLSTKAVRAQLYQPHKTRIVVAAHPAADYRDQMHGSILDPTTQFIPTKERS